MDDWAKTLSSDDGPDEEADTRCWNNVRLDSKQVSDLMNREPDSREGAQPENKERHKISSVGSRIGNTVVDVVEGWPESTDHETNTFSPNPRLHPVPHAGHPSTVEDRPKSTPDPKGRSGDDGE